MQWTGHFGCGRTGKTNAQMNEPCPGVCCLTDLWQADAKNMVAPFTGQPCVRNCEPEEA